MTQQDYCETTPRQTKYCRRISDVLAKVGHATNAELLEILRGEFPGVSATTVHRATTRLAARGVIAIAPPAPDGSMRYDGDTSPHDHFACSNCGIIRDAHVTERVISILQEEIADCNVSSNLVINGICNTCKGETT